MYNVSFPGLGINDLTIDSTAFTVFGRDIKWYGIIITFGMILACLYAYTRAKHEHISADDLTDYALYTIIFGILGARLYYIVFHFDSFKVEGDFPATLKNCVAIWNGGLAIYGGIIVGVLVIVIVSKIKKIKVTKFLDVAAPAAMIGQIFGRWGNFMNQEAFGTNTTMPWGMYSNGTHDYLLLHKAELAEMGVKVDPQLPVHPTFLYESLWNLVGFLLIHSIYKKKKYDGQIFLVYVAWYGFGRMVIEEFRTDSLMIGSFRVSQLVALLTMLAAVVILLVNAVKPKPAAVDEDEDELDGDSEEDGDDISYSSLSTLFAPAEEEEEREDALYYGDEEDEYDDGLDEDEEDADEPAEENSDDENN